MTDPFGKLHGLTLSIATLSPLRALTRILDYGNSIRVLINLFTTIHLARRVIYNLVNTIVFGPAKYGLIIAAGLDNGTIAIIIEDKG